MNQIIVVLLILVGCKSKSLDEWTTMPSNAVTAEVDGVKMTADLWQGVWPVHGSEEGRKDYTYQRAIGADMAVSPPSFSFTLGGPDTLEDFVKKRAKVTNWLRKDTLPDGYVASFENPANAGAGDYFIYVHRVAGTAKLNCEARVAPWDAGGNSKDEVPLLEKACLSLRLGAK